jgi:AraC family transcriptional regulator of adaptative response/methylated-DNA-[protein]-cysteine methyltransferase
MQASEDYRRIERAIAYLDGRWQEQPALEEIAAHVGLSAFHFQRLFHRWAGVSPKRFVQWLTLEHAKERLRASATVLDAAFDAGLSGGSRLHDLFVRLEAVTPGEYRRAGRGLHLRFGLHATPFGTCYLATTARGICALGFGDGEGDARAALAEDWPGAELARDDEGTAAWVARAFAGNPGAEGLALFVRATPFQLQVWRALLAVPPGQLTTYQAIARAMGRPSAARAVGNAVGANPVAWLIPCHRVIRGLGTFGGYRWGVPRKRVMLGWEAARTAGGGGDG